MTAKEKAKELFEKMISQKWEEYDPYLSAKQCALIAVDGVIEECSNWSGFWVNFCKIVTSASIK